MRYLIALLLTLTLAMPAAASELPLFHKGIRPLGMGGAFTAVANDENALFYNPAGLNRIDSWSMGLINPLIEGSDGILDFKDDYDDTDLDTTSEVTDLLSKNLGESYHVRVAALPHFVKKNFGIAALAQVRTNFEIRNAAYPEIAVDAVTTGSGHLGYAQAFLDNNLRVGVGAKYVALGTLKQVYDADDITDPTFEDRVEDDLLEGTGFGVDLGAMYSLNTRFNPIVGLSILNLGGIDLGDAGELKQQINIGASASHAFNWAQLTGAFDILDITRNIGEDEDYAKRIHMGLEATFTSKYAKFITLRAGLSQGYGSMGLGLDFKLLKIEYANYAEEISSYAGGKADRRHVVQLSLGW